MWMKYEIGDGVFINYRNQAGFWCVQDPKTKELHLFDAQDEAESFMEMTYG